MREIQANKAVEAGCTNKLSPFQCKVDSYLRSKQMNNLAEYLWHLDVRKNCVNPTFDLAMNLFLLVVFDN